MPVGKIEIDILANTAKLVKGMGRAEKTFQKSISNMTKAALGFAAVFVSGALISRITAAGAALDKIGKTSSKLGLTAEALQGLHLAATEAGISTNTFDMALQRVVRRVAEAAKGTGEAVGALNELGLSADELTAMTPDEMLKRVADSMSSVTAQSDKVRLAMKLFDSEGVSMVNMLKDGSEGLDKVAAKAEKLGLIIGGDYIAAVEKSNDAWSVAGQVMDTAFKGMNVGLSMALEGLVTDLTNSTGKVNVFATSLDLTKQVVYGAGRGFEILSTSIATAASGYYSLWTWMKAANGVKTPKERAAAWKLHNEAVAQNVVNVAALTAAMNGTSITATSLKKMMDTVYTGLNTEKVIADVNKTNDDIATQSTLWREVGSAATAYYNNLSNNTTLAKSLVSSLNSTISSGITGAFRQAMDGATSFSDTMKSILKDIIAQLIHTLVVTQAVAAALKAIGGGGAVTPSAAGGSVTVGGAMADGGIVKSGSSFLVGENGAEIVTLPKGANVTPNGGNVGGGVANVSVNVINNTSSNVSVEDNGNQIDIIIDAISTSITRGTGTLGNALETRYGLGKA